MAAAPITGRAIPILPSLDLDQTLAFYKGLGFAVVLRQTEPDVYAILRRDEIELHFWGCAERYVAEHTACYIRVSDADALHAEFRRKAIDGLPPIEDKPWGMREFHLIDPSGNLIRIGHPRTRAGGGT